MGAGSSKSFSYFNKAGNRFNQSSTGDIGEVFVGDVGWGTWEELNVVKAPGTNFGWPLFEGYTGHDGYMGFDTQNPGGSLTHLVPVPAEHITGLRICWCRTMKQKIKLFTIPAILLN